jgi:hypothetical protein
LRDDRGDVGAKLRIRTQLAIALRKHTKHTSLVAGESLARARTRYIPDWVNLNWALSSSPGFA